MHNQTLTEADISIRLREAGLRPTQQRTQLARLLWGQGCRHLNAETLHRESVEAGIKVSLATVYNTLHQFTKAGLLREIMVERGCSYFDTNIEPHHHFLNVDSGELVDIPAELVNVKAIPKPPDGMAVDGVDVIVRVCARS